MKSTSVDKQTTYGFKRGIFWITTLLILASAVQVTRNLQAADIYFTYYSHWWLSVIATGVFVAIMLAVILMHRENTLLDIAFRLLQKYWFRNHIFSWFTLIGIMIGYFVTTFWFHHLILQGYFIRITIYFIVALAVMLSLKALMPSKRWIVIFIGAILFVAVFYKIVVIISDISASPFSLGWSEGSRYYYASLYFSKRVFGQNLPLSALHPTRYLLMSIPFIVPGLPIWVHRLWQVLLWVGITGYSGFLFAKRIKLQGLYSISIFSAWIFLFLLQGPVYYHLLVCVILIIGGVDFHKPNQTFLVVVLAYFWAGLSRVNWIPVPVFLTIALYFFEMSWRGKETIWQYLRRPIVWGLSGLVSASIAYFGYIVVSGNEANKFSSSFTSDLLWYRLWPNPTYQVGILLAIIIVSFPSWVAVTKRSKSVFKTWPRIILLLLGGMVGILFVGGLIVSVKIGGGSNLHNMDAYLVLLMIVTIYMFWAQDKMDLSVFNAIGQEKFSAIILAAIIITPILATFAGKVTLPSHDKANFNTDLVFLQEFLDQTVAEGGEVIFISQRQLQVFNLIEGVPFISDYENIELMEMAMAGNTIYLNRFYQDLENQRFSVIISDPIHTIHKDKTQAFSEENNAWVARVATPILKHYQTAVLGDQKNIYILTPKP